MKPLPEGPLGYRAALGRSLVFGRREQHFPLTYVENLADAMALLRAGRGVRTFIVIDDENLTLGQYHATRQEVEGTPTILLPGWPLLIAAIALEILMWFLTWGGAPGKMWRRIRLHLQDRRFSTLRIREETGWAPRVSLIDAIRHTLRRTSAMGPSGAAQTPGYGLFCT
jgi:nucleoside-diphosphate-sugar epimerase